MATLTTRYVTTNWAAVASTVLKTPLPAADPNFPVANIKDPDRYVVHSYPATSSDCVYMLDVGLSHTITHVGFLNLHRGGTELLPTSVNIERGTTFGSWTAALPGASTLAINAGVRDGAAALASPVTDRYWRFTFPIPISGFALGKLLVASTADLGIAYSPGTTEEVVRQRTSNRNAMGARLVTETGPARRRFTLRYNSVPQATRDSLVAMASAAPLVLLHANGSVAECDLATDGIEVTHRWGPPDLYDAAIELEQLP